MRQWKWFLPKKEIKSLCDWRWWWWQGSGFPNEAQWLLPERQQWGKKVRRSPVAQTFFTFESQTLKIQNIKVYRHGILLQNCVKRKKLKNIYQRDLFQEWDGLPLNSGTCVLWNSKLVPTLSKVRPLLLYTAAEFSWDTCSSNIIDTTWQWIIWINCLQIN